ncbi:hypothetical protein MUCCIDRAFT_78293 [Mucor lusitanicus CBS 277.49]|uniref:Putative zinc-finger domain-containing protein n=1 Tax=Mucor lusitanicus CBS 277.49 TaxID=747725 RepID=A0A162QYB7_MUCCL|nr:hypothetical protein MUCCIDRAFT_78293 [Mucor lusitanicus CBS 277.49]
MADHFSQYEDGYLPVIAKTVSLKLHELIGKHIDLKQYVEPNNHKETMDMIFGASTNPPAQQNTPTTFQPYRSTLDSLGVTRGMDVRHKKPGILCRAESNGGVCKDPVCAVFDGTTSAAHWKFFWSLSNPLCTFEALL